MGREIDRSRPYIRAICDYGSGSVKAAGQYITNNANPLHVKIDPIQLSHGLSEVPQKAIKFNEELIWDKELKKFLQEEPHRESEVVQLWKIAAIPELLDTAASRRVFQALAVNHGDVTALQEFLVLHLRLIRKAIIHWYADKYPSCSEWKNKNMAPDSTQIEFMITVPCMWDERSCGIMRNAANEAGFTNVAILLEPLCVAGCVMRDLHEKKLIEFGSTLCFIDIGRGTADLATVRMESPEADGAPPNFLVVGSPDGDGIGGETVNEAAWTWVQNCPEALEHGGLDGLRQALGSISEAEIAQQFGKQFEVCKEEYPSPSVHRIYISAHDNPWEDGPPAMDTVMIRIPRYAMQRMSAHERD